MGQRYRITREMQQGDGAQQPITLEECKAYFELHPDIVYTPVFTVKGETTMSIEGDFFLWEIEGATIPFRHFDGDLYVSGMNEAVIPKMIEIASALRADIAED
ncbi:hypothetical protein [Paenibacillus bovis]|uniref:Uncharacterized protein n=1 Tax=Paenibacillus bovis TaxID=1616788 RepID=A0A172ZJ51_9BACL|nr:hypothetical protein [Paenibacillus bovis]ANF97661.1 hypothetical protein AR543_17695 [Paenibacillus bovis]